MKDLAVSLSASIVIVCDFFMDLWRPGERVTQQWGVAASVAFFGGIAWFWHRRFGQ